MMTYMCSVFTEERLFLRADADYSYAIQCVSMDISRPKTEHKPVFEDPLSLHHILLRGGRRYQFSSLTLPDYARLTTTFNLNFHPSKANEKFPTL